MIWPTRLINLLALVVFLPSSNAEGLDVVAPLIYYPKASTVWRVGEYHHVVWDVSGLPPQITNRIAQIYLVRDGITLFNHNLAPNIDITIGRVEVQVPYVESGQYQVNLFGDSGDRSSLFLIEQ